MNFVDAFLGVVFLLIGIVILLRNKSYVESFENEYYLASCPTGTQPFYAKNGDMMCCKEATDGNKCSGIPFCSMSSRGTDTELFGHIRPCVEVQREYYKKQSKLNCPSNIPNFYVSENHFQFCTSGPINHSMDGPLDLSQKSCAVHYGNKEYLNNTDKNSCYNQKLLDKYPCFGIDCVKEITLSSKTSTPLISVMYTDPDGIRHSTITRETFANYLKALSGKGINQLKSFDINKNILITEVSKAVFVDKTLDKSQVQF